MSEENKPLYARLAAVSLNRAKKSVWADLPDQLPAETKSAPPAHDSLTIGEKAADKTPTKDQQTYSDVPASETRPVSKKIPVIVAGPVIDELPVSETLPPSNKRPAYESDEGAPFENNILPLRKEPVVDQLPVTKEVRESYLAENAAHLRFPYEVLDKILFDLKPGPHVILEKLYRLSAGWDRDTCRISIPKLASSCKVGLTQTRQYLKELEMKGYITRLGEDVTNPNIEIRGVDFKVNLPRMPPPKKKAGYGTGTGIQKDTGSEFEPNKIKNFKEQSHKNTPVQDTPTAVETPKVEKSVVSVNSKFSLAECRLYADHLHKTGQGIVNPGGYATTIYRTGEADPLIDSFLNPVLDQTRGSIAGCPDCKGTGFWYPDGFEKGAAKCRHEKLAETKNI